MNPFLLIILIAIILEFVINLVADILNLKALKLEVPVLLKGIYRPDEYRNSQQYTRSVTRFAFVTSSFRLALLLAFWFGGGFMGGLRSLQRLIPLDKQIQKKKPS